MRKLTVVLLSLIVSMMCVNAAWAAPTVLTLGDIDVLANPTGEGYSYADGVLTLDNYSATGKVSEKMYVSGNYYHFALYSDAALTIKLKGDNLIANSSKQMEYETNRRPSESKPRYSGIRADGGLIIENADGEDSPTLTVKAGVRPIWLMGGNCRISGVKLDLTSTMFGMSVEGMVNINNGSAVNVEVTGNQIDYEALQSKGLSVESASLDAITNGYYYDGDKPIAIKVQGNISVKDGYIMGKSSGSGNKNSVCQGMGVYCQGNMSILENGRLYAYSYGKKEGSDTYDGSYALRVNGTLSVSGTGTISAQNYNSAIGAVRAGALSLGTSVNNNAVITFPFNYKYEGGVIKWYLYPDYVPATRVRMVGLEQCSLYLREYDYGNGKYEHTWIYRYMEKADETGEKSGHNLSDGVLNLTEGATSDGGESVKPDDYKLVKEIVVQNGQQVLELDGTHLLQRKLSAPYITVKSGATLTLRLQGINNIWQEINTTMSSYPWIKVESGATLNIEGDGGISVYNKGGEFIAAESGATVNIKGGDIYTAYSSTDDNPCSISGDTANVNISGGWLCANIHAKLNISGGTLAEGTEFITYSGETNPVVTVSGGSVGMEFEDKVSFVNKNGTPVYRTKIRLYNASSLLGNDTAKWKSLVYVTDFENLTGTMALLPNILRVDMDTADNKAYTGYGLNDVYAMGENGTLMTDNPYIYLYLPEGTHTNLAMIQPTPTETLATADPFYANLGQDIVTTADGKAEGTLFLRTLVIGEHITAFRDNVDPKYKGNMQLCPQYDNADTDVWYDYEEDKGVDIGNTDNTDKKIEKFGILVKDGEHNVTIKRLDVSGENKRLVVDSGTLNLLLNGTSRFESDKGEDVVNVYGTLNISGSYTDAGGNKQSSNGWLIFKGDSMPFAFAEKRAKPVDGQILLSFKSDHSSAVMSVTDCVLANECSAASYADYDSTVQFQKLSFSNATVLNMSGFSLKCDNITIDGGSVDINTGTTVKNSNGDSLTKARFTVSGISDYTKLDVVNISGLPDGATFATENIWTDKSGNITLWLPSGAALTDIKIGEAVYYPVTNADGSIILIAQSAPVFTEPVADSELSLAAGDEFKLTVRVDASPAANYQWQKYDGTAWQYITGATNAEYSGTMSANLRGALYRCAAANTFNGASNTVYSAVYKLIYMPSLAEQPVAVSVKVGKSASFSVRAEESDGVQTAYQWQVKQVDGDAEVEWQDIVGANESSYTIDKTARSMDGWLYRCVMTCTYRDDTRYVTSDEAELTVKKASSSSNSSNNSSTNKTGNKANDKSDNKTDQKHPNASDKQGFDDVPKNSWFEEAVNWAVSNGITDGVDNLHFAPTSSCTRAQMVTMLWRLEGKPTVNYAMSFTDVDGDEYFAEAVRWAAANGVVTGYTDGSFGGDDLVTREQTVAILWRLAKLNGKDVSVGEDTNILSYSDAEQVSEYAVSAMQWACGAGVVSGDNGSLLPQSNTTRAEMVIMLMRYNSYVR